jgi:hypothetical protein|tara:strand:- start:10 stop:147 length:138 start_codon:yes stop_codon:yes gene_type:complete
MIDYLDFMNLAKNKIIFCKELFKKDPPFIEKWRIICTSWNLVFWD